MTAPRLLLAVALALAAAAPAHASGTVQVGQGSAGVSARASNENGPAERNDAFGEGLTFSRTVSAAATGSASATIDAEVRDLPDAMALGREGSVTAQAGTASATVRRTFEVTEPTPFRVGGRLDVGCTGVCSIAVARVRITTGAGTSAFDAVADFGNPQRPSRAVSGSGTLPPGLYEAEVLAECSADEGCSAAFEADLLIGLPPTAVVITSGPPPSTTDRTASFAFEASPSPPPPGAFECRLDDGAFSPCTSPAAFGGLAAGAHRFAVRFRPDGRDPGPVSERTWTVQGEAPCPEVRVGRVLAAGCFTERAPAGSGIFETAGDAWVGGFHLWPRAGGKLVVQPAAATPLAAEGTGVDWVLGPVLVPAPLGELRPFEPSSTLSLGSAGAIERFVALPVIKGLAAEVTATWEADGRGAKLAGSVSLEKLTKNLGKALAGRLGLTGRSLGTLAAKLGLRLANGRAAELTDGELQVPEFAVELAGTRPPIKEGFGGATFKARRVGASVEWSGEVALLFPWQADSGTNQGTVTGRLRFVDGEIAGVGLGASGFEARIGRTGWDLTGISGDVLFRPSYAFDVGVEAQQRTAFADLSLFKLTGNLKALRLAEGDCSSGSNPVGFAGTFNAPPLEQEDIGELKGRVTMCAYLQGARDFAFEAGVSGRLTVDVGPFNRLVSASGSARGWFSGTAFNLDGSYELRLPLPGSASRISATGVLSSEGYAVCGRYGFIQAGFATDNWLEPPEDLQACDFTPFRASTTRARAAQDARTVVVPRGARGFAVAVDGDGGAPRVRVLGPGGARFTAGVDGLLEARDALVLPSAPLGRTYVYLRRPRAGRWRIEPLPGSAPVTRLRTSRQLPPGRVRASVTRRRDGRLLVRWSAGRVPGRTIELVDRADGVATTIQRPTRRTRGRVLFRPANALARRRTIEAVLVQDGSPRPPLTVARVRLPAPRLPGAVRAQAQRSAQALQVRWRPAARARDYLVTVLSGGEVLTRATTRGTSLRVDGLPAGRLAVQVAARDRFGRPGPTAALDVAAGR